VKTLQTLVIVLSSLTIIAFLIKCIFILWNKISYIRTNYERVIKSRLAAYQLLNNALSMASVTLKYSGVGFHGCFLSAGDYFQFKNLLSDAEKEMVWYTKKTATYLKEYIELIDSKAAAFGLTMYSKDILYQEFGIKHYQIIEDYQNKLLESILSDYNTIQDVKSFLASKDGNNDESSKVLFQIIV